MFQFRNSGGDFELIVRGKVKLPDPLTVVRRLSILYLTWEGVRHAPDLWSALGQLARTILFGLPG